MESLRDKLAEAVLEIEKKGILYADARALSWHLQEMRKVVLSELMRNAQAKSMTEKEMIARCSQDYKLHLEGTREAIKNELVLKAQCERWKCAWESIRSLISLEKKKMEVFNEE